MASYFSLQSPLHVAIIMDGNGRWALGRGLPRVAGHRAGAQAVRRVVEAAPDLGIGVLTLFAFSADNWRRPPVEVAALMKLFGEFLEAETARLHRKRRAAGSDRAARPAGERAVPRHRRARRRLRPSGTRLLLRIAVDYSGREAILAAARELTNLSGEALGGVLGPAVDLLIRTGGERRLSDFLLWESAYAELVFSRRMWPDFDADDLAGAVREFRGRERRFGGVPAVAVAREAWLD